VGTTIGLPGSDGAIDFACSTGSQGGAATTGVSSLGGAGGAGACGVSDALGGLPGTLGATEAFGNGGGGGGGGRIRINATSAPTVGATSITPNLSTPANTGTTFSSGTLQLQ
jgi:hypothetical protein